eukprot:6028116-Amphidinium_carterae.2
MMSGRSTYWTCPTSMSENYCAEDILRECRRRLGKPFRGEKQLVRGTEIVAKTMILSDVPCRPWSRPGQVIEYPLIA